MDDKAHNEERFKLILDAMQDKKFPPQKIFFDGQFYDAFVWLKKYIRMTRKELIVIDPYFAASVLPQIAQTRHDVLALRRRSRGQFDGVTEIYPAAICFRIVPPYDTK